MFKSTFDFWIDKYFYRPRYKEMLISMLLSPFTLIYTLIVYIKPKLSKPEKFKVPVISVGNLVLGGSGKTPLVKAIFNEFSNDFKTFIILRGYKRSSKGMLKVALQGEILSSVQASGDEAMEYALSLKNANVIVSENRKTAINEAINLGAKLIILDDGFGKFDIFKFNILLKSNPEPIIKLPIPSGAYRYPISFYKYADFIPDQSDIIKTMYISNRTQNMLLVTAIANPMRLKNVFGECIGIRFFKDHYKFKKEELEKLIKSYNADSLLVTMKDYVKIKDFGLNISLLELKTEISTKFKKELLNFIQNYN
ncbi:tetraacyldisaccharide 4'-kinase [Campylobacter hyointestinalis]|uniref:Tetraacyldisaccharide 4'-kinase n=1 Tax=Campylobacter hyointestinalis subsp. hyointestinalis TaxID=91352 RepID=A0A0S4RPZ6_CAMHY|nr:tetraacyldisaccharide 4'-kinase [Campylobacter hyointestinalis]PPB52574.1 tetraacyldisaccharide 4'-kinase [Campylobacter hyointestinalis subsp. hyointestinalis]PPB67586.1 tetraacyldisaccharide 4'-kinase [Campylobacter hyointestinalis subsp. hyointestinalis]PPB69851.1 tetraacyldisaccharide 4'-kinase [Campylobacter hyointestinalis subsp. hyointestinalis]CUU69502.1 tetraacyldisaccharide 4'-kinase [Campylobacter hyointestinalis subsp. hyointestinalis]CUU73270.1 tetraacyldisaccharide 4'-kinase [